MTSTVRRPAVQEAASRLWPSQLYRNSPPWRRVSLLLFTITLISSQIDVAQRNGVLTACFPAD